MIQPASPLMTGPLLHLFNSKFISNQHLHVFGYTYNKQRYGNYKKIQ